MTFFCCFTWFISSPFSFQSRPLLKDQKKYSHLADPRLQGRFPRRCLNYAIAITAMCLNEEATYRPMITDIVVALDYLASQSENNPVSRNAGANSAPSSTTEFSRGSYSGKSTSV